jgi:hypothetical protein
MEGWRSVRARRVHAVVDLNRECNSVGTVVREHGMRYLRLSVDRASLPEVEELHIVTTWIQQRIREGGAVLLHDPSIRGNDGVVACAVLIKQGASLAKALLRLEGVYGVPLSEPQIRLLYQFVAQRVVAKAR